MPPKKSKGKDEAKSLEAPKVSEKELTEAKRVLQSAEEKRRANSNMMYWLNSQDKRAGYDAMSPADRKDFALSWFAWSLKESELKKGTKRRVGTDKIEKDESTWMCKKEIIDMMGDAKGNKKIKWLDTQPDRHRPDPDTKDDDEDSREYRVYKQTEETTNFDNIAHELDSSKAISNEKEKLEAEEDMASFGLLKSSTKGSESSGQVGEIAPTGTASSVKVEGQQKDEDLKTFHRMQSSPKMVLRSIQEAITELKRQFEIASDPKKARHTETIRSDITKLLPKLKISYNSVEKIHLKAATSDAVSDPEVLAVARKLDKEYASLSEIQYWFGRMCPKV
jgi:hypothetical protein